MLAEAGRRPDDGPDRAGHRNAEETTMGSGITDADGYPVPVTVTAGETVPVVVAERGAGQGLRVGIRLSPPPGHSLWYITNLAGRAKSAVI
ncbi:hypothetical protein ACFWJY_36565 [Streptomyces anulatus]|uniref:hypothetical protein n=1 Tax=Streptomyces anulatus TaxID=1892 RepID=UPI0036572367